MTFWRLNAKISNNWSEWTSPTEDSRADVTGGYGHY